MRRQLYIGEKEKLFESKGFFVAHNKALDIKKKDRTINLKINY
ncbi:hypothetical protein [Clostridium sartagoforme]|nr:hypothetical protein [Clostridium sartagoforme]